MNVDHLGYDSENLQDIVAKYVSERLYSDDYKRRKKKFFILKRTNENGEVHEVYIHKDLIGINDIERLAANFEGWARESFERGTLFSVQAHVEFGQPRIVIRYQLWLFPVESTLEILKEAFKLM
ncbi:MAG: hypothetical protein HY044_01520 [Candidatus Woesebacteria bacterium]|nr:MAG: hypothetical protein HY044_01520 [Candidatus Woesebacteria bacterium]